MARNIKQSVALVTGANRGIGKAILKTLLANGFSKVYAAVRDPSSVDGLVQEYGDRVIPVPLDLSQPATITAAAETAKDVDLVINNAGVLKTANPLASDAVEALQFEMEVNVNGLLRMA